VLARGRAALVSGAAHFYLDDPNNSYQKKDGKSYFCRQKSSE
jgi:hypothetical protein